MKAFICFAIFAVATAIPLEDTKPFRVPNGPIPFEMLRNFAPLPMPVWRDLPINNLPQGDMYIAIVPIPNDMLMDHSFNNLEVSGSNVKVVDFYAEMPANDAGEVITNNDVVGDAVKVAYASEPDNKVVLDDKLEVPALPSQEADDLRFVKIVDGPGTLDLKNIHIPRHAMLSKFFSSQE